MIGEYLEVISSGISFPEPRRRQEIYHAEIARITALKEQGICVEKEKVYAELYKFGQIMRNRLQSIPDQVVDAVLAPSRNAAHMIMKDAFHDALEDLTTGPKL